MLNLRFDPLPNVFYDKFEEAKLWGKDLYVYLNEIYREKAKYTIMFISENYSEKLWTNHERKSMQERAFRESREYILPARFDDTEIPGVSTTVGYIDLRIKTPIELSELVIEKLELNNLRDHLVSLENVLLSQKNNAGERAQAAIAIRQISNKSSIPALTKALHSDDSESVRAHSAIALKKIGDESALSALLQAYKTEVSDSVKTHCSLAINSIMENKA
ncbi:MAG: Unknown protein [uncultured Thiotrichaceae bacterium]|uniref:TIR domain-containing protein n=1 Tax=uncultured Thiotrichaceae bacterium TaxID=298394 RepID=A0A6S6U814_9GAMM|nr:MAG: Unknown protein [uncultured Thiotrichaceae bacterium]